MNAPEVSAQQPRASWPIGDVVRGLALFILVFAGNQVLAVLIGSPFGLESTTFYAIVFVFGAMAEVVYALIALGYAGKTGDPPWRALGVRAPSIATIGWAVAGLIGALAAAFAYTFIIEALDISALKATCDEQIPAAVREDARLLALAAFVVLVFAPPCEELFFRGFVFQGLAGRWGVPLGILISALLFAAPHLTYKSLIPIFAAGVVFAATFWRSGNLVSSILAHAAFNAVSIASIASGACD